MCTLIIEQTKGWKNMKRLSLLLVLCLLLSALAACNLQNDNPTQVAFEPSDEQTDVKAPGEGLFYGMIVKNMGNTLLVTENKTQGKTAGLFTLATKYLDETQDASVLVPGTYFTLQYGGYIMESYPAQFGAPAVFKCDTAKEDLVTPLVSLISEKVPQNAKWLALDLSAVENLSDGEKEAVQYLLMCQFVDRCSVVQYDENALKAEDLLTADGSPENGAVLRLDGRLENGKLIGTWTLTDSAQVTEGVLSLSVPYYLN